MEAVMTPDPVEEAMHELNEAVCSQEEIEECGTLEQRLAIALKVDRLRAKYNALCTAYDDHP
jgi:hypothetical protein